MGNVELSAKCAHAYTLYGRACDDNDIAALRGLAVEDITFTINGPVVKQGQGIEAFLDLFRAHPAERVIRHEISSVLATRSAAGVSTSAHFAATTYEADKTLVTIGLYRNLLREAEDGTLRIAHQVIDVQRHLTLPASVPVTRRGPAT